MSKRRLLPTFALLVVGCMLWPIGEAYGVG